MLDSETEGSLTLLVGEICKGGMGDLLDGGCHWYQSVFYSSDCKATLATVNAKMIEGSVVCGALGANCPAGTGLRTSSGACMDGERYEPISLTATFRLQEPLNVLDPPEPNPMRFAEVDTDTNSLTATLDRLLTRLLEGYNVPGASIAIVHDGQLIWARGYGWADVGKKRQTMPNTIFAVKSLSKPFTAWAVMWLAEQGRLDLDVPIDQYLSRWHLPASQFDKRLVTARRLLSHTAGISGIGGKSVGPTLEASLLGKAKGAVPAVLQYQPGEFHYSDHGYSILQLAIEEITGESFAAFMEEEMLSRAGALPACYVVTDDCMSVGAIGYETNEDYPDGRAREPVGTVTEQAAFGLNASAPAVARFIAAIIRGLEDDASGQQILGAQSIARMLAPASTANVVSMDGTDSYGLGFALTHLKSGELLASHGGGGCCNKALLSFLPEEGEGIVVLTNGTQGHMLMQHVQCEWLAWTNDESGEGCGGLYDIFTVRTNGSDLRRVIANHPADVLPRWSPDGSQIAYNSSRNFNQDIYVADTSDWHQKRLTTNSSFDASPAWSPDGSRIAFTRADKGVSKIYLMKPDGSGQRRLSKNPGDELLPSWSPDGTSIVFAGSNDRGLPLGIWIISADGTGLRRLGTMEAGGPPMWSLDGLSIAFSSGGDIYVTKVDGSKVLRLTYEGDPAGNPLSGSIDPAWSPDSRRIVFASGPENDHDIFLMNADGSGRTRLTSGPSNDRVPSWSPDGSLIAFSSTRKP